MRRRRGVPITSPQVLRMGPPLTPDEDERPDCPECGAQMRVTNNERKGELFYFKAVCRRCGHVLERDNLP